MVRETVVGGRILSGKARQEAFDDCHVFRHWWQPSVVDKGHATYYIQELVCMRCGGERKWKVNRATGKPMGNLYNMPDGYYYEHNPDEDLVTRNGRLRIQEIERNLAERARRSAQRAASAQGMRAARGRTR